VANEITLNASLAYEDSEGTEELLSIADKLANVSTKRYTKIKQNVAITEEALALGDVTAPGYVLIINRDATNFVNVKVATAGAIFAKLLAGECCLLRLGSGAQAPYVIADTATCQIEILLIST
jgi:hypothetical protein